MSQVSTEQQNLASAIANGINVGTVIPNYGLRSTQKFETNALDDREFADAEEDKTDKESFNNLDLLSETVRLFRQTKKLLSKVLSDTSTPANQQAQVVNTLSNLLRSLSEQQTDLFNAERLKRLENVVITLVKDLPVAQQEAFLVAYEREVCLAIT